MNKLAVHTSSTMTPREIVQELDRHIVGQHSAKRAVAIALRNRWRRMQLDPELRDEVMPKNILMIGPTGVGKTEIARRLATLANAPFVKVEATRFTEVGYVGKDVEHNAPKTASSARCCPGGRSRPCSASPTRKRKKTSRPRKARPAPSCASSCAPARWTNARSNSKSP
jgi:hypothetical protein